MTGPELWTSLKNNSLLLIIFFELVFMQKFRLGWRGGGEGEQSAFWSVPEGGDYK